MIPEWMSCLAHSRIESTLFLKTIALNKPLPPEYIHKHYNFTGKIPDPLLGWKLYNAETGEYEEGET
jgi:hypothetical protein